MRPPKPLTFDTNMEKRWKDWIQQFNWYSTAVQLQRKTPEIQAATLMSSLGSEAAEIYNTFNLTEQEETNVAVIKQRFTEYFTPRTNVTYERYMFNRLHQEENEPFDCFITKLKTQIKKCDFGAISDSLLVDKIIIGIKNEDLRKKLLTEENLTLERAVNACKINEQTSLQLDNMISSKTVESVKAKKHNHNKSGKPGNDDFDCRRCGTKHGRKQCPAYKKKCETCGIPGHVAAVCRSKSKAKKTVNLVQESDSEQDEMYLNEIIKNSVEESKILELYPSKHPDNWYETVEIGQEKLRFKLDTGAQCNVLPYKYIRNAKIELHPSKVKRLISFSDHRINVIGEATIGCKVKNKTHQINFKIINENTSAILGRKSCEDLGLIIRVNELKTANVFDGLGCLKNFEYDIDLVENPQFEKYPARRIPHAIRQQVKSELDSMVKLGVIRKMDNEVSPVVSPMVIVRKNSKLRICLDPTDVNKNIQRRYYPLKSIEEIAARVHGSRYFTLLDCTRGFWQIKVSKRTEPYLAFSTPWGRYCFQRLPFGLASAPEVFSEIMNRILDGIEHTEISMDDILVHASTKEELEKTTQLIIDRLQASNLKLNKEKCLFNQEKIKFLGHLFSSAGIEVDPAKVDAINRIQQPKDKTQLQRFLGMVNYMGKFIPHQADLTVHLRKLTHKDAEFIWQSEHEEEFIKLKSVLSNAPVLKFYDVNDKVTLSVDASSYAIGAVLLQNNQPIAYASTALTKAQQNYPQIEKEATAIKYGCKKFHEYVYGKQLTIETDHKPLEIIFKKPIHTAPPRLQRILFDVTQYAPDVHYKKGAELYVADTLSRDCKSTSTANEPDMEIEVHVVMAMSKKIQQVYIKATEEDEQLNQLRQQIQDGWPSEIRRVPQQVKPFWTFREELSAYNGLIFKGEQVVVPKSQQKDALNQIHHGHLGIQSCIRRARAALYWNGMCKDITDFVNKCAVCQSNQRAPTKEPTVLKDIPTLPWEIVATDLFKFLKDEYLLICDSFTGYFDFEMLRNQSSNAVIQCLKKWFAVHGIPRVLESDNGPQYNSREFRDFQSKWGFEHQTSSPKYPKSNGLAERFVQTAKGLLKKCTSDNSDVQLALLNRRNVPRSDSIPSPNERLMSRITRTTIPIAEKKLQPKISTNVHENLKAAREKQKEYADQHSKQAPPLKVGDNVRIQQAHRNWTNATIVQKTPHPRSYIVQREDGSQLRRNTSHIRPTEATITPNSSTAMIPSSGNDAATHIRPKNIAAEQINEPDIIEPRNENMPPAIDNNAPTPTVTANKTRCGRTITVPIRYREN